MGRDAICPTVETHGVIWAPVNCIPPGQPRPAVRGDTFHWSSLNMSARAVNPNTIGHHAALHGMLQWHCSTVVDSIQELTSLCGVWLWVCCGLWVLGSDRQPQWSSMLTNWPQYMVLLIYGFSKMEHVSNKSSVIEEWCYICFNLQFVFMCEFSSQPSTHVSILWHQHPNPNSPVNLIKPTMWR